jgi:hypothetical protein
MNIQLNTGNRINQKDTDVSSNEHFKLYINDFDNSWIFEKIKDVYQAEHVLTDAKNVLTLKLQYLRDIILNYPTHISWELTIRENIIPPLDIWMIHALKSFTDWSCFICNARSNIFNILKEFKDEINWWQVQTYSDEIWNEELIDEFRDYLIFNRRIIKNGKATKFTGSSYYSWTDREYKPDNYSRIWHGYTYTTKEFYTLSESPAVKWTENLIEKFYHYWDWNQLSLNAYLPFSNDFIETFLDSWNWSLLSGNNRIYWSKELLMNFKDRICPQTISSNSNVDWENATFILNSVDFDWERYSMNRSFNTNFLKIRLTPFTTNERKWEKIVWKDQNKKCILEGRVRNNKSVQILHPSYTAAGYAEYSKSETAPFSIRLNIGQSLSANPNIIWTDEFISLHLIKLDFWIIALRGKLTTELVIKYAAFFDEIRVIHSFYQKNSDWPLDTVLCYHTGWENLFMNPNFVADDNFYLFAANRIVRIIDKINIGEDSDRKFYNDKKKANDYIPFIEGKRVSVEEIFKNPQIGFRLKFDFSKL